MHWNNNAPGLSSASREVRTQEKVVGSVDQRSRGGGGGGGGGRVRGGGGGEGGPRGGHKGPALRWVG